MLTNLALITSLMAMVTGFSVIGLGNWRPFQLKFAAVALSTVAAFWYIVMFYTNQTAPSQILNENSLIHSYQLYHVVRNIAFILFHIAVGRDAIHYKQGERRKNTA